MTDDGWQIVSLNSHKVFKLQKEMERLFPAMEIYIFLKDMNNLKISYQSLTKSLFYASLFRFFFLALDPTI